MTQTTSGARPTRIYWSPDLMRYDFGSYHPMHPSRLESTWELAQALGVLRREGVTVESPEVPDDDALAAVHDPGYIAAVRRVSEDPERQEPECGLGTEDTPGYAGIHEASARLVGGSLQAAQEILDGRIVRAVNFSGGMHHAARARASGFCVYNDCAVAVQRLLDGGLERVVYVDVDGHHGDGTQSIFWDDPRVMTVSIHETGAALFPGTGFANEIGEGAAAGTSVNLAMPPLSGDAQWLRALDAVLPPLLRQFAPQAIVSQHGCDSHFADDLTHLRLSVDAQRELMLAIGRLAEEHCEGRWIATGGGGYAVHDVVPRSWTHLMAVVTGDPLPVGTAVPEDWRTRMRERHGGTPPRLMGDDVDLWWRSWEVGYDPDDDTDRVIMSARKEVFPSWGLDPWYD